MQIFVVQGGLVGLLGTLLGVVIGIPLAYKIPVIINFVEEMLGARMLEGTFFSRIPTDVRASDIAMIVCVSLLISLLATFYPAYRAARLQPAQVLRSE
jgi:lipoprotein-releasing system permease protein